MQTHKLEQGSDLWHQFRLDHFGASEAAAMLGLSTKVKRNELLHIKHTGQAKEYSDWVENKLFAISIGKSRNQEVYAIRNPTNKNMKKKIALLWSIVFDFFFSCNSIVYILELFVIKKIKAIIFSSKRSTSPISCQAFWSGFVE